MINLSLPPASAAGQTASLLYNTTKGRFAFRVFYCAGGKILVDFYCSDFHFISITFIDLEKCSVLFDWTKEMNFITIVVL